MKTILKYTLMTAAGAATLICGAAMAQSVEAEVQVIARRAATLQVGSAVPVEVITIYRGVSYRDLDLTTKEGAAELDKRIHETATDMCRELDAKYPTPVAETGSCITAAVDKAMHDAHKVIDAKRNAAKPK